MSQPRHLNLPSNVNDNLRELWIRSLGAADASNAAHHVAKTLAEAYQQKFADCLSMLGCDPNAKWWIDFRTGEVHEGEPPSQAGAAQPLNGKALAIGAEDNPIKTNG